MATKIIKAWIDGSIQEIEVEDIVSPEQPLSYEDRLGELEDKPIITDGNLLVGNGTEELEEMTPEEVLSHINGASVATMTTEEYEALEESNANTLYVLTDSDGEASGENATVIGDGAALGKSSTVIGSGTASGTGATVIGNGTATGDYSVTLGNGAAIGDYSLAGGTTDSSLVEDVTGVNLDILTDDMIIEKLGERGLRLKDNIENNPTPTATGDASVTYGTGNHSITALSNTYGVGTEAGSKGFYLHKITIPEDGGNITISLSTVQKPYYKYQQKQYLVTGDLVWKEGNSDTKQWDAKAGELLAAWSATDKVNIILKKIFCLCESIVSIDSTNGNITVTNTGGFNESDVSEAIEFSGSSGGIDALASMSALVPYQFSVAVPAKPNIGIVELHFAATATGLGSIAAGTLSQAHGRMNLAAGQFGFVVGQNNEVGYGGFASGQDNIAIGHNSHAEGGGTQAIGQRSHAEGDDTEAIGDNSHAEGAETIATKRCSHAEGYKTQANGVNSHAEGFNTRAVGNNSHAEGYRGVAYGKHSHVEGYSENTFDVSTLTDNTTIDEVKAAWDKKPFSLAYGIQSHAEGSNTVAFGNDSHAEGYQTAASGDASHAEGSYSVASGSHSHAEGSYSVASGSHSHAEGYNTEATGVYSHAEGYITTSSGHSSHAEGRETVANHYYAHAEGLLTEASGSSSHAEGSNTQAIGHRSHAEGDDTIAAGENQHVQGKYNIEDIIRDENGNAVLDAEGNTKPANKYAHIVGNGSASTRSNAHTLDWDGNAWFAGAITADQGINSYVTAGRLADSVVGEHSTTEGTDTIASGTNSHAEGWGTEASGDYSHAEGRDTHATQSGAHAEGYSTTASGYRSHAEGINTTASGNNSHAEGQSTSATAARAHAEGRDTTASNDCAHAEGYSSVAEGKYSHAEGHGCNASGEASHAQGMATKAIGNYAHAEGNSTTAKGADSHAEGLQTITSTNSIAQHVQGKFNIEDTENKYAHIVGNGTVTKRSNAHTLDWEGLGWFAKDVCVGDDNISLFDLAYLISVLEKVVYDGAEVVKFTFDGRECKAIAGTTWREFIGQMKHLNYWITDNNYVAAPYEDGENILAVDIHDENGVWRDAAVKADDIITANEYYFPGA